MVNDLYKRFLVRSKPPKHYVLMARICMILSAVIAGFIIGIMESMGAGFISSGYKDAIALVVLLLVLFLKPTGLMGRSELR